MSNELQIVNDGKIELCPHQGCSHTCCDFANGNFIALFPGELAKAQAEGKSIAHLDVVPDGAGGHRAICRAYDKASCDNGYKPLDCASYPLFPSVGQQGRLIVVLKGSKCPLQMEDLSAQHSWVESRWKQLGDSVEGLEQWLDSVRLVGYEQITDLRDQCQGKLNVASNRKSPLAGYSSNLGGKQGDPGAQGTDAVNGCSV